MDINTPIVLSGDISDDGITRPDGHGSLRLGSVEDLAQIQVKLNEDGDMSEVRCAHCGEDLNEADPTVTAGDKTAECDANDGGPHEKEWAPLTWAKNICVSFNEERDEIELGIATADPRGGWTFKLRRTPEGVVLMHLPHDGMTDPHEPIKELHSGTFAIG